MSVKWWNSPNFSLFQFLTRGLLVGETVEFKVFDFCICCLTDPISSLVVHVQTTQAHLITSSEGNRFIDWFFPIHLGRTMFLPVLGFIVYIYSAQLPNLHFFLTTLWLHNYCLCVILAFSVLHVLHPQNLSCRFPLQVWTFPKLVCVPGRRKHFFAHMWSFSWMCLSSSFLHIFHEPNVQMSRMQTQTREIPRNIYLWILWETRQFYLILQATLGRQKPAPWKILSPQMSSFTQQSCCLPPLSFISFSYVQRTSGVHEERASSVHSNMPQTCCWHSAFLESKTKSFLISLQRTAFSEFSLFHSISLLNIGKKDII